MIVVSAARDESRHRRRGGDPRNATPHLTPPETQARPTIAVWPRPCGRPLGSTFLLTYAATAPRPKASRLGGASARVRDGADRTTLAAANVLKPGGAKPRGTAGDGRSQHSALPQRPRRGDDPGRRQGIHVHRGAAAVRPSRTSSSTWAATPRRSAPIARPASSTTPASARIRFPPSASSATRPEAVTRRALVVGAGIGGLAAALALARQGFGVDVFERAPALQEFGAGLQLTPNATRALARLGALAAAREVATAPARGARPARRRRRRTGAAAGRGRRAALGRALSGGPSRRPAPHPRRSRGGDRPGRAAFRGRGRRRRQRSGSRLGRPQARRGQPRARPARRSSAPTGCARWCAPAWGAARPTRRGFPTASRSAPRSKPNGSRRAGATAR